MVLKIIPVTFHSACAFIDSHHRHHGSTVGHRFSIGVLSDDRLCGVAVCGRPIAPRVPQDLVLEVARLATDGTPNACSKLYSASARIAREMGFEFVQTYILHSETGCSLRASGWHFLGVTLPPRWKRLRRSKNCPSLLSHPKQLWGLHLRDSSYKGVVRYKDAVLCCIPQ